MQNFVFRFLFLGGLALAISQAYAGVANTPHFVAPGELALGLEPELTLTNGAGLGFNARYTQGLTDLNNFTAVLGTGSGPRRFRAGGNVTFDFFPDAPGQPGIGLAAQSIYWRLAEQGRLELTLLPYIHKTFSTPGGDVEPFFSIPFGWAFSSGTYKSIAHVAVGSMFKNTEHFRYLLELGVNVNNSDSYISGGVVYYP